MALRDNIKALLNKGVTGAFGGTKYTVDSPSIGRFGNRQIFNTKEEAENYFNDITAKDKDNIYNLNEHKSSFWSPGETVNTLRETKDPTGGVKPETKYKWEQTHKQNLDKFKNAKELENLRHSNKVADWRNRDTSAKAQRELADIRQLEQEARRENFLNRQRAGDAEAKNLQRELDIARVKDQEKRREAFVDRQRVKDSNAQRADWQQRHNIMRKTNQLKALGRLAKDEDLYSDNDFNFRDYYNPAQPDDDDYSFNYDPEDPTSYRSTLHDDYESDDFGDDYESDDFGDDYEDDYEDEPDDYEDESEDESEDKSEEPEDDKSKKDKTISKTKKIKTEEQDMGEADLDDRTVVDNSNDTIKSKIKPISKSVEESSDNPLFGKAKNPKEKKVTQRKKVTNNIKDTEGIEDTEDTEDVGESKGPREYRIPSSYGEIPKIEKTVGDKPNIRIDTSKLNYSKSPGVKTEQGNKESLDTRTDLSITGVPSKNRNKNKDKNKDKNKK